MLLIDSANSHNINLSLLAKYRKTTLVMTILLFICSISCLLFPLYAGLALGNITGIIFIVCGIYTFISLFSVKKRPIFAVLSLVIFSLIYLLMGYGILINPIFGVNTLSLLFCFLFILGGLCRITSGVKDRHMTGRYWCIFIGLLDLAIAFIWLSASENANFIITTIVIGLELLFCAWFSLITTFALENAHTKLSAA